VINDRPASWVNLLTYLFRYQTCVAWWQMTVLCKHGFQRQRLNFDRKFVYF